MTNRKHLRPIFIAVALFAVGIFGFQNTDALSGLGTQRYPYRINTCDQLQQIESNLTASYALNGDIDCDGITFSPITNFQGHLDGRNFTIDNLNVNSTGNHTGNGALFQKLTGATVSNLKLTNVSLDVDGGEYVGSIAGLASATTIDHVFVEGSVVGDAIVGGLVGSTEQDSTLNASSFTGSFTNSGGYTGGLVAIAGDTVISNSYVDADGLGGNSGGGLVARIFTNQSSSASITNSYATGSYRDGNYRGGVAGFAGAYSSSNDPVHISNVFSTTLVTFNGTDVSSMGGVVGQDETSITPVSMSNVIYDNTKSGNPNSCVASATHSGCSDVSGDGQFTNNSTNEPFKLAGNQLWDFDTIWQTTSGLPSLREATLEPLEGATSPSNPNFTSVNPGPDNIEANWVPPGDDYLGGEPIIAYHLFLQLGRSKFMDNYRSKLKHYQLQYHWSNFWSILRCTDNC